MEGQFKPCNHLINAIKEERWTDFASMLARNNSKEFLEERDPDGKTALIWAVIKNNIMAIKLLLALGANVNAADNEGDSPVMWAVRCGSTM
jgi:ankyrin repeat protein